LWQNFTSIVWPSDYWVVIGPEQTAIASEFVQDLEQFLKVDRTVVSFKTEWDRSAPVEAGGLSLQEYTVDVSKAPLCSIDTVQHDSRKRQAISNIWYDEFQNTEDFRERYIKEFGRYPYVSPPVREVWYVHLQSIMFSIDSRQGCFPVDHTSTEERGCSQNRRLQTLVRIEIHELWHGKYNLCHSH
jgi:hypothetical protein